MSAQAKAVPQTPQFSAFNYVQFFAAGGLCATITHAGMTPVDVIKTRLQLEPAGSKQNVLSMAAQIVRNDGPGGLLTGFGSTAVGYLIQGGAKFCGYEFFKKLSIDKLGYDEAAKYRQLVYLGSASAAEVIATTLLTPLEASRIRLVGDRSYAGGLVSALSRMWTEEGIAGFYAGYVPILFRQVPYAVGQFYTNEMAHSYLHRWVSPAKIASYGKVGEIGESLGCGIVAGIAAAVLSHPADTLLSKINKGGGGSGSAVKRLAVLAYETGPVGLWAGLGTRIIMTTFLVSGQFLIYDQCKAIMRTYSY